MTVSELKHHVEDWMNNKFHVTLKYDPSEAIKQLENLGLLITKQKGTGTCMHQPVFTENGTKFVQRFESPKKEQK